MAWHYTMAAQSIICMLRIIIRYQFVYKHVTFKDLGEIFWLIKSGSNAKFLKQRARLVQIDLVILLFSPSAFDESLEIFTTIKLIRQLSFVSFELKGTFRQESMAK